MNNLGYLFAAYAIIWLTLFAYCYRLGRRQEELRERLGALRRERRASAHQAGAKASAAGAENAASP